MPQFYEDVALTCGATRAWHSGTLLRVAARQIFGGIRISAAHFRNGGHRRISGRNERPALAQAAFNSFRTPLIFRHCSGDRRNRNTAGVDFTGRVAAARQWSTRYQRVARSLLHHAPALRIGFAGLNTPKLHTTAPGSAE